MRFKNITIIEDSHLQIDKTIKVSKKYLLSDLVDIQTIELYEAMLLNIGTPYILAEVNAVCLENKSRTKSGYGLFVHPDEIEYGYYPEIKPFKWEA